MVTSRELGRFLPAVPGLPTPHDLVAAPALAGAAVVAAVPLVPFDEPAARLYATLPFSRGRFDRLLAAHALSLGATIVTNNGADFADVPGLVIEDWTQ